MRDFLYSVLHFTFFSFVTDTIEEKREGRETENKNDGFQYLSRGISISHKLILTKQSLYHTFSAFFSFSPFFFFLSFFLFLLPLGRTRGEKDFNSSFSQLRGFNLVLPLVSGNKAHQTPNPPNLFPHQHKSRCPAVPKKEGQEQLKGNSKKRVFMVPV